jgi:hypothetical protein
VVPTAASGDATTSSWTAMRPLVYRPTDGTYGWLCILYAGDGRAPAHQTLVGEQHLFPGINQRMGPMRDRLDGHRLEEQPVQLRLRRIAVVTRRNIVAFAPRSGKLPALTCKATVT